MNKLISFINLLIVLGLMLFTSCEENLKSADLNTDYLPLQVGNYWDINTLGTMTIDEEVTLGEKEYFRLVRANAWMKDTLYFRKSSDGNIYSRTLTTDEALLYNFKAAVNESWQNGTMRVTLSKRDGEMDLGNTRIKNCYVFYCDPRPKMADDEYSIWLAPGIGFVYEFALGGPYNQNFILKKVRLNGIERTFE